MSTAARVRGRARPFQTASCASSRPRYAGLRGHALQKRRTGLDVGQEHIAAELGLTGPQLSAIEREKYGGMPRGMSARYQAALEKITSGASPCFERCGCRRPERRAA